MFATAVSRNAALRQTSRSAMSSNTSPMAATSRRTFFATRDTVQRRRCVRQRIRENPYEYQRFNALGDFMHFLPSSVRHLLLWSPAAALLYFMLAQQRNYYLDPNEPAYRAAFVWRLRSPTSLLEQGPDAAAAPAANGGGATLAAAEQPDTPEVHRLERVVDLGREAGLRLRTEAAARRKANQAARDAARSHWYGSGVRLARELKDVVLAPLIRATGGVAEVQSPPIAPFAVGRVSKTSNAPPEDNIWGSALYVQRDAEDGRVIGYTTHCG